MGSLKLEIPYELERKIEESPDVNWSKVAREAMWERASKLSELKSIISKSKLTEKDALKLGRLVNKGFAKRYRNK